MSSKGQGLTRVSVDELKRLLRAFHRKLVPEPIRRSALIEAGFGHVEEHLDALVGRDLSSAQAIVSVVLAERSLEHGLPATLAYSGVPLPGTLSKDNSEHVRELLGAAVKHVTLVGVPLGDDRRLMRTLSAVMEGRGISARLVLDAHGVSAASERARAFVAEHFRNMKPEAFVCAKIKLAARVVVADGRRVLVTSGELVGSEDDGRIDVGAVLDDAAYAAALEAEWERLIKSGSFEPV